MPEHDSPLARVGKGARFGLALGALFSAYIVILYLIRGEAAFEGLDLSPIAIMVSYLGWGAIGGSFVGLLMPWTRSRIGAMLVGIPIGVMVYGSVGLLMADAPIIILVGVGVVAGAVGGLIVKRVVS